MTVSVIAGDCRDMLATLPDRSVNCCVTSPPYFGLRDYGMSAQIGLELTPDAFIAELVAVFREVRRVLRDDGTLWLNIGDSYAAERGGTHQPAETLAGGRRGKTVDGGNVNRDRFAGYNPTRNATAIGVKHKDLIGIPWMLAFALRADGWYLRQEIIWHKPNPMPESVTDRCTKAHESLFLLSKRPTYYFDAAAIAERSATGGGQGASSGDYSAGTGTRNDQGRHLSGGFSTGETRNKRSVWTVPTQPYSGAHFATFPPALIEPCIQAGCPVGGTVLDPFFGAGTTGLVADRLQRNCIGIELNPEYAEISRHRIADEAGMFGEVIAA